MSKSDEKTLAEVVRPIARTVARELSPQEIEKISGGRPSTTHATGPNGDDPSDPGSPI